MQMTLLDPHPANPAYSQFSAASFVPYASDLVTWVTLFENLTLDPQVIIPSNVDRVFEFDQQTPAGQLQFLVGAWQALEAGSNSQVVDQLVELALNLWGELAASIPNHSGQTIQEKNLTNVFASNIGLIGHSDVPLWYVANVVNADETFTYFG
jgi:hypothetical protein